MVAALDRNRGLGLNEKLLYRIPGDMAFFVSLTTSPDPHLVEQSVQLDRGWRDKRELEAKSLLHPLNERPIQAKAIQADSKIEAYNGVILGRKTWDSIPAKFKPFKNRFSVILSASVSEPRNNDNSPTDLADFCYCPDFSSALQLLRARGAPHIYVIGGESIYRLALQDKSCERLYLTEIDAEKKADTFFPKWEDKFSLQAASPWIREGELRYRFTLWLRNDLLH